MRRGLPITFVGLLAVGALVLGVVAAPPSSKPAGDINFEGLPAGTIVSQVSPGSGMSGTITGTVGVHGFNPLFPGQNAAMIFDSSCAPGFTAASCSGGDKDLGTPNQAFTFKPAATSIPGPGVGAAGFPSNSSSLGKTLILSEDLDSTDPDDADKRGMWVDFDFSGVAGDVSVDSVTLMDIEKAQGEDGTYLEFWTSGSANPTDLVAIPPTGDNGVVSIKKIDLANVDKMRVNWNGSGATTSVIFGSRETGTCWSTTGGFQNSGFSSGSKDFSFGGNVGPPPSGVWEVVDHVSGDNFHSNDVEVVGCEIIDALTGPGQPGGKKGLQENLLHFRGTGRLRDGASGTVTDGLPFVGCVIDAGEPAGKQGLNNDYFEIVVCEAGQACQLGSGRCSTTTTQADLDPTGPQDACDALGTSVVFAACGALDGGNVQIHPPTGRN